MKAILAGVLVTLALETMLLLAFWAGSVWFAGWLPWPWGGVALATLAAGGIVALFAGDLDIAYHSGERHLDVGLGWIGRFESRADREADGRVTRTRVLFVRWTKRSPRTPRDPRAAGSGRPGGGLGRALEPVSRTLAATAPALHELLSHARELRVRVVSPTGIAIADRALLGLVGHRRLGPLDLELGEGGGRAIHARYRVRLYRALLVAMAWFAEGRPDRISKAMAEPDGAAVGAMPESSRRE